MALLEYRKTATVFAEQFLPEINQIPKGVYSDEPSNPRYGCWVLDTLEGRHYIRPGDYICTGTDGEQWNVKEEIFNATYELVK